VYRQLPGEDPERTVPIPRIDPYAEPRGWAPGAPGRPDGFAYGMREDDELPPSPDGVAAIPGRRRRKKSLGRELLTLAAVALLLTFLIQHFLGRVYLIPSGSMEKTLHGCPGCDNDRVLVDKLTYAFTDPQPGDVIVFQGPDTWTDSEYQGSPSGNIVTGTLQQIGALVGLAPPDESDYVKRVIAVGGQTVQCCDKKGRVLVDGKPLDEPYIYWQNGKPDSEQKFDPVTVPKGTLWVMGDNRNNSEDSRKQGGGGLRGVVPVDNVIGKARSIVLPTSRWSGIGDHNPQGDTPIAMGAPAWQQSLPAGFGLVAAWPVLWVGRKIGWLVRPRGDDRASDE
jgi:signal peptidase I